jgi:Pectate lyase superfamily protein
MTSANRDPAWGGSGGGSPATIPPVYSLDDFAVVGDLLVRGGDPHYDVRAFGAVGNGSTDDTAAIQAAIDAAAVGGKGGIVLIPHGAAGFVVSQIKLKLNVTLEGTGLGSNLICKANNANAAMIVLDSSAALQTRIKKLFLNGNSANQSGVVHCVQYLRQTGDPFHILEDCYIFSWTGRGVDCDTQAFKMRGNRLWDCQHEGVYISYHDAKLFNNTIGNSGYEGIYFESASNCEMVGNGIAGSGVHDATRGDGVRVHLAGVLKASNNECSDNQRHGWNLDGSFDCTIYGGAAGDNNAAGTTGAPLRLNAGGRHDIKMHLTGGGRATEANLIRFDTDGSSYPQNCSIDVTYQEGAGGAIGATNAETIGTFASNNLVRINQRIVNGSLDFNPTKGGSASGAPIRLKNNSYITGRNNADSGDVSLLRVGIFDELEIGANMVWPDNVNVRAGTSAGCKIGTATSQKLAFFNSTPVIQPATTGETVGFTAGAGTAVNDASTFTGNVGTKAYRLSDIVKHLKNLGLIAAS